MRTTLTALSAAAALGASSLALSACSASTPASQPAPSAPASQPAAKAPATAAGPVPGAGTTSAGTANAPGPTVPGYAYGQIPPVPLFTVPDLGTLTADRGAFPTSLTGSLTSVPGVTVGPARCDSAGVITTGSSTTVLGGDGSGTYQDSSRTIVNYGDGAGTYTDGAATVVSYGDGSGSYTSPTVSAVLYGDGSGNYTDQTRSVVVYGGGAGTYSNSQTTETITVYGGGSGTYTSGAGVSITNYGDGSGTYTAPGITIVNYGDGTGTVNGVSGVQMDPLAAVGDIGSLPKMAAFSPVESCGTVISLDSSLLFDFDSYQLLPEAQEVLRNLTTVLNEAQAPQAQVVGHTDSLADDAYNQTLSEQRAQAVASQLQANGAATSLTVTGYGETRPVAPNTNADGSDNPAGRQLNRRVEILVPSF